MPVRVLEHGFAPTVDNFGLEHGVWGDIAPQGQFLLDVEFIMRYSTPTEGASCIYCHTPSYMRDIAAHFPWIHFYGYSSPPVQEDYDPVSPYWSPVMTSEVKGNITTTMTEFTSVIARRLGDDQTAGQNRIFVCHGESMCHQLCLHALLRAQNSFLDVCGVIPMDYVEGEMMLPLYLPNNKIFVSLVTWQHAKCRAYDPVLFENEIGFYQGILRVTQSFDETSKDVIVSEFAKNTHVRHGCEPEIVRVILLATVDLLVPPPIIPAASGQEEADGRG